MQEGVHTRLGEGACQPREGPKEVAVRFVH